MLYIVTDCDGPGKERGGINGRNIRAMDEIFKRLYNAYFIQDVPEMLCFSAISHFHFPACAFR